MPQALDIIIPVYNRAAILKKTLEYIVAQSIPRPWQVRVIVVNDGSTENIQSVIESVITTLPVRGIIIECVTQKHSGIAAARNRGIKVSTGDIILFLGADILLQPGALEQHIHFHEQHPDQRTAALGGVTWDPTVEPTALMDWMIHGGSQNDMDALLGKTQADPHHFLYGSHCSLKKSIIPLHLFPEAYQGYGWEDIAAGHTLAKQGLKLYVLHNAIGLHHHSYTWADICRRQYMIGQNYSLFIQDHHGNPHLTSARKIKVALLYGSGLYTILWVILTFLSKKKTTPFLFKMMTSAQFWRGVWKGQKRPKNDILG